jgi:acyl-coenzyme A thioesterase PaaI-like protein
VAELQPNSQHCFVCGLSNPCGLHLRFYTTGLGQVTADITLPEMYQGYPGVVHGGIVAAMLDEAAGRAHMGGDPPRFMFTARMEIRYRKNVPVGKPLHVVGSAGKSRSRTAAASAYIEDSAGEILAEAEVLLVNIPGDTMSMEELDVLGWKVYPLED